MTMEEIKAWGAQLRQGAIDRAKEHNLQFNEDMVDVSDIRYRCNALDELNALGLDLMATQPECYTDLLQVIKQLIRNYNFRQPMSSEDITEAMVVALMETEAE